MTTNWMEQNRELFRALKLEQVVTFIVIALIVIVAALNILIALTMMVMEKTRDIAVMMSFGVEPGQVRRIFLLQGLLISLIGTALGLALGYAAAWAGGHYHFIHLSAEVYSIDTLPFAPRPIDGSHRLRRLHRHVAPGHPLPLLRRRQRPPRRSPPVRIRRLDNTGWPAFFDNVTHFVSHYTHAQRKSPPTPQHQANFSPGLKPAKSSNSANATRLSPESSPSRPKFRPPTGRISPLARRRSLETA